ncbi:unnamed protein product [Pipistrellus nathusii]|uniref:Secreted protein n=1 Tax=Pipistrellus nathusii TaxID=59473 RepID=A0ABP0A1R5_PIPNA
MVGNAPSAVLRFLFFVFFQCITSGPVVSKLISQQSQISTVKLLKFLLRAKFFKLKLLLMSLLQNRLTQAVVFCGRATLKGPKSRMWLVSRSLLTTALDNY